MITQFNDYTQQTTEEYLGTFEKKMMVFENYWDGHFFSGFKNTSVLPYLGNIGNLIEEDVTVGHRFIDSKESLSFYLKDPGIIWSNPESWGTCVWSFNFHGTNEGIYLPSGLITKDDILEICKEKFRDFPNILYFSCCHLFEDEDFCQELLKTSGTRGVLGFTKKVGFCVGTMTDLLFLSSFFKYNEGDPFENLETLYNTVLTEFPVSKEIGFTLFS
jgi:hypothetical protein